MLLAVAINSCAPCRQLPVLGWLKGLTQQDDGIIIVATLLLFPTTAALYGGLKLFFAAREAVRRDSREKGRQEGRQEERERIKRELAARGMPLTPEQAKILDGASA